MARIINGFAGALAGGVFFAAACFASMAQDVSIGGVNVDVNDNGGTGLGVDASVGNDINGSVGLGFGGSGGTNGGATASIGGASGVNGNADVSIGGGGADASATASIGGGSGGGGADANIDIGIGNPVGTLPDVGGTLPDIGGLIPGGDVGRPPVVDPDQDDPTLVGVDDDDFAGPAINRSTTAAVGGMSGTELTRFRRRCADVLRNSDSYDSDLVGLCRAIRSASR